jgi:hypothetical protein
LSDKRNTSCCFGCLGAFVLLAVIAGIWLWGASRMPVVNIPPTPKPPSPNAYDYYVKAGASVVDSSKVAFAMSNKTKPASPVNADDKLYSVSEKAAIIRRNAQVLKLARQGLVYDCMCPPVRSYVASTLPTPDFAKIRQLARLFSLDAQVKEARGDWAGGTSARLDTLTMGQSLPEGGNILTMLVGSAVQSIGRADEWKAIDHLNGAEAKTAAHRMEGIVSKHVPFVDVLTEEKWSSLATIMDQVSGKAITPVSGLPGAPPRLIIGRMTRGYIKNMDEYIASARQPYAARVPIPPPSGFSQLMSLGGTTLSGILTPVFDRARFTDVSHNETQNVLLCTAFAIRAYKADHGKYPAKLSDLVPTYLSKVPADPFALKGSLRYMPTYKKYILYSIGPDGKDNGGNLIYDPAKPADQQFRIEETSRGDVVAGVNLY